MLEHRPCYGVPSAKNESTGESECYMSYVGIHSCCLRKCLRYAQIHLQYGQLYMSYVYFHWYVVCFIRNESWSIYDISIMFCSMYETFYVVSKNTFVCFNWFVKWAKIAHSVSTFSLQCCICKIIHLCSRFFMLLGKNICGILRFNFWPLLLSYF